MSTELGSISMWATLPRLEWHMLRNSWLILNIFSLHSIGAFFYHISCGHWRPLNWLNSWSISSFVALNMNCLLGYLNAAQRSLSESGVATILDPRDSHLEFWVS